MKEVDDGSVIQASKQILRVAFGSAIGIFEDSGTITIANKSDGESWLTTDPASIEAMANRTGVVVNTDPEIIPIVGKIGNFDLPSGCGVVMGGADVGKTPVLRAVAKHFGDQAVFIRYGEPLPGYMTRESEAAEALLSALLDPKIKVICVDSVKDLLSSMGGALMARGIPRTLFKMISQWGTIASSLGKLILIPLNISTDSEDAILEVEAAVNSNATLSIFWNKQKGGSSSRFLASARTGEGKLRVKSDWVLSFDGAVPVLTVTRLGKDEDYKSTSAIQDDTGRQTAIMSQYVISAAISRSLTKV